MSCDRSSYICITIQLDVKSDRIVLEKIFHATKKAYLHNHNRKD